MSKKQTSFLNNWAEVQGTNSVLVRQKNTGRQGERRMVALDPLYDPKNQQAIYTYRKDTKLPFISAYGSEILQFEKPVKSNSKEKTKQEVKDPYNHMVVITQRIPHLLATSPQLTYPESLYVLDQSLTGFEAAYEKCGPMRVNDHMIGFNNQGQCKVWVNQDFANNHPSFPRRRLMSTRTDSHQLLEGKVNHYVSPDESDMVQDVVDTVQNYCQQGRFPEPFATRIHQKNLSFAEARRLIQTTATEGRGVPIPNRVDLFTNIVRGWRTVTQTKITNPVVQPSLNIINTVTDQTKIIDNRVTTHTTGYKFNYIPPEKPYHPEIFASRVGEEQGAYRGLYRY